MKRFLMIPMIGILFLFTQCNNDNKTTGDNRDPRDREDQKDDTRTTAKGIVGKWKPVDIMMNDEELTDSEKEEIYAATIEFKSGGRYTSNMSGKNEVGTYVYDETDKTLEITEERNGRPENFDIKWDGDRLVMTSKEGKITLKRTGSGSDDRDDNGNRDNDDGQNYGMARDREQAFPGKWKVVSVQGGSTSSETGQSLMDYRFEFTRNGKYYIDDTDGKEVDRGTYTYDAESDQLKTTDKEGTRDVSKVRFVSLRKMVVVHETVSITLDKD